MISVEDALARLFTLVRPLPSEQISLRHATGRRMTTPATARRDQPPFAASAMDGYALTGNPIAGDTFTVAGEAGAGHAFTGRLEPGQAIRIFTGAPIPHGATRVVIQEDVTRHDNSITINATADAAAHIRPAGQDFRKGAVFAPRCLRPHDLALLASMNVPAVTVTCKPTVAIIATGDELVMPGEEPRDDQIIASNSFAIAAMVEQAGGTARMLPIARDTMPALQAVLTMAHGADVIVTIGGASVGDHDLVARAAGEMGFDPAFWKIAMRPGKPLMAGRLGNAVLLGLPGNPVSAIVCAHLFLLPLLGALQGDTSPPATRRAILGADVAANGPRAHYMRARLTAGDGLPVITPFDRQDSALLTILSEADALLIRPIGDAARAAGEAVDFLPLSPD
jgi:molybdopterin molybdotransferase